MSKRGRKANRAQRRVGLATGAGSAAAIGLEAPVGYSREHVLDVEGLPSTVIRRIDNLARLVTTLGGDRVNALIALRMATEAMERGLTPRCGLDMSPGAGPDGYIAVIQHRLDAARIAGQMWAAIPAHCEMVARVIVVHGWSVEQLARNSGTRVATRRLSIRRDLEVAADAVNSVLDQRFGRSRMRCCIGTR